MRRISTFTLMILAAAMAVPGPFAATYLVPDDEALVKQADLIVRGRVLDGRGVESPDGTLFTDIDVEVEKVLKGNPTGPTITLRQLGGRIDDRAEIYPGIGDFGAGERVLLLLDTSRAGPPRLLHFALGKFRVDAATNGREVVWRNDLAGANAIDSENGGYVERLRDRDAFELWVEKISLGQNPAADYFRDAWSIDPAGQVDFNLITVNGNFSRWSEFDNGNTITYLDRASGATGTNCPTGCHTETSDGMSIWNDDALSNIALVYGGTYSGDSDGDGTLDCLSDLNDRISYDDPCDDIADLSGCGGTLGLGGFSTQSSPQSNPSCAALGNPNFWKIVAGRVMINNDVASCINSCDFQDLMTHEVGHSLGFGHSNDNAAVMFAFLQNNRCGALAQDDQDAANCVYPQTALSCSVSASPIIGEFPLTVSFDSTVTGGAAPFTFDWNFGDGNSSSDEDPMHTYTAPGMRTATLDVTDADGVDQVCNDSIDIMVQDCISRTIATGKAKQKIKKKNDPTRDKVKIKLAGTSFQTDDVVQIDNGGGFFDLPVETTKIKKGKKVKAKVADPMNDFPRDSCVDVRVRRADGCVDDDLIRLCRGAGVP